MDNLGVEFGICNNPMCPFLEGLRSGDIRIERGVLVVNPEFLSARRIGQDTVTNYRTGITEGAVVCPVCRKRKIASSQW